MYKMGQTFLQNRVLIDALIFSWEATQIDLLIHGNREKLSA